ncbi:hypothetical protein L2E82_10367 [Cichorium intybus]|uniref:Uncharacterized protein n=1 Tax=Cichorium intybus TaxID=13427 RepID=A0ACB9GBK4_CICIN|nr:hypothetical protein L2E82_10367 [Cichorium intybus]
MISSFIVPSPGPKRIIVELAIPCEKPGLWVFEGFTVGFHPRSWEIVYNGMTQFGYEKVYKHYRFGARVLLGSGSFIARNLTLPSKTGNGSTPPLLSPLQAALRQIWSSAYPNRELPGLKSEVWKEMGW